MEKKISVAQIHDDDELTAVYATVTRYGESITLHMEKFDSGWATLVNGEINTDERPFRDAFYELMESIRGHLRWNRMFSR